MAEPKFKSLFLSILFLIFSNNHSLGAMTDPSVEPRILKFSDYATSKVVDVDADFVRLNLISFDDTYGKIGVFAGIWKRKQEEKSGNKHEKDTAKYTVKIEDMQNQNETDSFIKHEAKMYDRLLVDTPTIKVENAAQCGFLPSKCMIHKAKIVEIPGQADVHDVCVLVVQRSRYTLHEIINISPKSKDLRFIMEVWKRVCRAVDFSRSKELQVNHVHSRTISGGSLNAPFLSVNDFHFAEDLRAEAMGDRKYYLVEFNDNEKKAKMVIHQNTTSTASANAVKGGERTESDECFSMVMTCLEIIVELPLTSNHIFNNLNVTELYELLVVELLRLRTNYIDEDGSADRIFEEILRKQDHWIEDAEFTFKIIFLDIKMNRMTIPRMRQQITNCTKQFLKVYNKSNPK